MLKTLNKIFKQDKEKIKVPKFVQDIIPVKAIYEDGRYGVRLYKNGRKTDSLVWENANWSIVSEDNVKIIGG